MPTIEPRVIPDDYYSFDLKDLNTLVIALQRFADFKEVMHPKEAAAFMGIGTTSLYKSEAPYHKIKGMAGSIYAPSY